MGAGEGLLAEDGLVAAEEGELGGLDDLSKIVFYGPANVEDSAQVGHIGIVSVGTTIASEGLGGLPDDLEVPVGEDVRKVGGGGAQDGEEDGDGLDHHCDWVVVGGRRSIRNL